MATQTKTVRFTGITGQTQAFADYWPTKGTGVASVTLSEVTGKGIYTASVNWDDSDAANEPIGEWVISLGDAAGSFGQITVLFTEGEDDYSTLVGGGADVPADLSDQLDRIEERTSKIRI